MAGMPVRRRTRLSRALAIASGVRSFGMRSNPDGDFAAVIRDVVDAAGNHGWALIGGLAAGLRSEPRGTQDVDVLVDGDMEPFVAALVRSGRFKRHQPNAVEHRASGIEVETLTADYLRLPVALVAVSCAEADRLPLYGVSVPVASARCIIALKLGRALGTSRKALLDRADILGILARHGPVSLSDLPLGDAERALYRDLEREAGK